MVKAFQVLDGVYQIDTTPREDVPISKAFLVVDKEMALIETGPASRNVEVVSAIRDLGFNPADISYVIPTHIHIDHAGGAGLFAQQFPKPRVVVHETGARHALDPSRLLESTRQTFGDKFDEIYGDILPIPADRAWIIKGGETFSLGPGHEFKMVHTPGHAPHHFVVFDNKTGTLFAGEAAGNYHEEIDVYTPAAPPPAFDPEDSISSYEVIRALNPTALLYSHCGLITDVERALSEAAESAKGMGEVALAALKAGGDKEEVTKALQGYISERIAAGPKGKRFSPEQREALARRSVRMAVAAYTIYFKRKGMVT